jgi:hypothetical protein
MTETDPLFPLPDEPEPSPGKVLIPKPWADEVHAVARRGDPETSWQAAESVKDIRGSQQEVLSLFRCHGPMTDEEVSYAAKREGVIQSPSGLRTRRRELVDLGLLQASSRRSRTASGRSTIIWEVAS